MKRIIGLAILGILLGLGSTTVQAADATGTWKWTSERNGQKMEWTLKLKQDGDKLSGTMAGRQNETAIEDAKVTGDEISFKVVREFNGNKMTQKYKGKVGADTIKGNLEVDRNGETNTRDWEAKKGS